jgi:hypothetical protein
MASKPKVGGATSVIEYSPIKINKMRAAAARTERRWAAMAGPVRTRMASAADYQRDQPRRPT